MTDLQKLNLNHLENCRCFGCPQQDLLINIGDKILASDGWGCLYTGVVYEITAYDVYVLIKDIIRKGTFRSTGGPRGLMEADRGTCRDIARTLGGRQENYYGAKISMPDHPSRAKRRFEWVVKVINDE